MVAGREGRSVSTMKTIAHDHHSESRSCLFLSTAVGQESIGKEQVLLCFHKRTCSPQSPSHLVLLIFLFSCHHQYSVRLIPFPFPLFWTTDFGLVSFGSVSTTYPHNRHLLSLFWADHVVFWIPCRLLLVTCYLYSFSPSSSRQTTSWRARKQQQVRPLGMSTAR